MKTTCSTASLSATSLERTARAAIPAAHVIKVRMTVGLATSKASNASPKTFESELAAFKGSAFSVAPKLTQSAYFRPSNKDSGIPGLYLVGAGTHPGAGLPGVLNSAKATVDLILSNER